MHQSYKMHFGSRGFLNCSWSFSGWQASNGKPLFKPEAIKLWTVRSDTGYLGRRRAKFLFIFFNSTECFNKGEQLRDKDKE